MKQTLLVLCLAIACAAHGQTTNLNQLVGIASDSLSKDNKFFQQRSWQFNSLQSTLIGGKNDDLKGAGFELNYSIQLKQSHFADSTKFGRGLKKALAVPARISFRSGNGLALQGCFLDKKGFQAFGGLVFQGFVPQPVATAQWSLVKEKHIFQAVLETRLQDEYKNPVVFGQLNWLLKRPGKKVQYLVFTRAGFSGENGSTIAFGFGTTFSSLTRVLGFGKKP
jgi:hypothetical protein